MTQGRFTGMINWGLDEQLTLTRLVRYRTFKGRWMEGLWGRSRILALALTVPVLAVGVRAERPAKIEFVSQLEHSGVVLSVVFSADGAHVLSASDDSSIKLWDAATGALIRTFEGHSGSVRSIVFSPDGTRVLSGSSDQTMKLWDAATGAVLRTFEPHENWVRSVAFSADGNYALSGSGKSAKLWSIEFGRAASDFR